MFQRFFLIGCLFSALGLGTELVHLRLDMDGSVTPPGDRLQLKVLVFKGESGVRVTTRALVSLKRDRTDDEPVLASADARPEYRNEKGELRFETSVPVEIQEPVAEKVVDIIFPYSQFQLAPGQHRLFYEVEVSREEKGERVSDFKTVTRMTLVEVRAEARTKMIKAGTPPEITYGTKTVQAYLVKDEGETQAIEVSVKVPQAAGAGTEATPVDVHIPGGFERDNAPVGGDEPKFVPQRERRIFYATNRNIRDSEGDSFTRFGNELSATVTYGDAYVKVPLDVHKKGKLEEKGWMSGKNEYFFVDRLFFTPEEAFIPNLGEDDVLLYVHGFQNSFNDVLLRAAQIQHDLEFPGKAIAFSWPSQGSALRYGKDEEMAESKETRSALMTVLKKLTDRRKALNGKGRIHIIAHSMGARVTLLALNQMALDKIYAPGEKPFGHVVFAAADIGLNQFGSLIPRVMRHAQKVSYYYSLLDMALGVSAKLHHLDRAGLHPYFCDGMETINVDNVSSKSLGYGHAYYSAGDRVLMDLNLTIQKGLSASERRPPLLEPDELKDFPGYSHYTFQVPAK